jgi:serine phosphatase RsbU (regulator of sigma subunit)
MEYFGNARLIETIENLDAASNNLLNGVYDSLLQFAGSSEQFDDITLLALHKEN